jgi:hypothetical protein
MTDQKEEAFCSFDVELDGTNPLEHSMRSIGIGLFVESKGESKDKTVNPNQTFSLIDTFYKTLQPQEHANGTAFKPDSNIMCDFWNQHPEQWKAVNTLTQTPKTIMFLLARWLEKYQKLYTIKWVASPANCDWMWLKSYYERYGPAKKPSLGHYCHDLSSLLRAYMLCHNIKDKTAFMQNLSENSPYTHHALDDAICQGKIYMNLRFLLRKGQQHLPQQQCIIRHENQTILLTAQILEDDDSSSDKIIQETTVPKNNIDFQNLLTSLKYEKKSQKTIQLSENTCFE